MLSLSVVTCLISTDYELIWWSFNIISNFKLIGTTDIVYLTAVISQIYVYKIQSELGN